MLSSRFKEMEFNIGRDGFYKVLRNNGLLISTKKRIVKTTNSIHRFRIYTNLIKGIEIKRINEVIVSDITYIETEEGFMYLA